MQPDAPTQNQPASSDAAPSANRGINWKLLVVLCVVVAGATSVYQTYPTPEDVMAEMWDVRAGLLEAVREGDFESADKLVGEWSELTARLPRASLVHRLEKDAELTNECAALQGRLDALRDALPGEEDPVIRQATIDCFEQHRQLAADFYVAPPEELQVGHEESGGHEGHAGHQHGRTEHPSDLPAPAVEIEVLRDPKAGWNVHIMASNFQFAPEHASLAHIPGEGHAHLYVDGKKVARVYGEWFHLANPGSGKHHVRVTLNTNDHNDLTVQDELVEAFAPIHVPDHRMAVYFGDSDDEIQSQPGHDRHARDQP